jgi:antitoxin component of MazEF toxin-antitoxin module
VIVTKVRKQGNSYVVTIPRKEMERLALKEGQSVGVELQPMELRPVLRPELREHFEAVMRDSGEALRYLAEH